jgi:hypothetical protein
VDDKSLPAPILVCDEPEEGTEVTRGTVVSGWAYSPAGIEQISVWFEGQRVGVADLGLEREDVARDHPWWPGAERSGYRYQLTALPVSEPDESVELAVVAEDGEGRRAEVRRLGVQPGRDRGDLGLARWATGWPS